MRIIDTVIDLNPKSAAPESGAFFAQSDIWCFLASPFYSNLFFDDVLFKSEVIKGFTSIIALEYSRVTESDLDSRILRVIEAYAYWVKSKYSNISNKQDDALELATPFISFVVISETTSHIQIRLSGDFEVVTVRPDSRIMRYSNNASDLRLQHFLSTIKYAIEDHDESVFKKQIPEWQLSLKSNINQSKAIMGLSGFSSPFPHLYRIDAPRNQVSKLLIASAGFSRLWNLFEVPVFDVISEKFSLGKLSKSARIVEESDSACSMHPRLSRFSDNIAILIQ